MMFLWDFNRGRVKDRWCFEEQEQEGEDQTQSLNPPFGYDVAISATGTHVAAGLGNGSLFLSELTRTQPQHTISTGSPVGATHFPVFTPHHVLSGSQNGRVTMWQYLEEGSFASKPVATLECGSEVTGICSLSDGRVYVSDQSNDILQFSPATGAGS
mmetsp:Transcript_39819/g.86218  ORF Transcript_39819/g.86218 Transcript_39819/m.86218 type:complete len:157 (-) Transcript_39819:32-502(-)